MLLLYCMCDRENGSCSVGLRGGRGAEGDGGEEGDQMRQEWGIEWGVLIFNRAH